MKWVTTSWTYSSQIRIHGPERIQILPDPHNWKFHWLFHLCDDGVSAEELVKLLDVHPHARALQALVLENQLLRIQGMEI